MTIWGILIGGAAGLAMGGPIGGLLGAAAGLFAEQQIRRQTDPEQARKVAFTVAVIALSAKMAKADGMVTKAEIEAFRARVDIPQKDIERVGKFWDLARQTPDGFGAYARQTAELVWPALGHTGTIAGFIIYHRPGRWCDYARRMGISVRSWPYFRL